jgi:L-erythro-3,5-diaminohexanoate dehydrogenase
MTAIPPHTSGQKRLPNTAFRSVFPGGSPLGLHRVLSPDGVLPQAAWQLDPGPALWPDEVRVDVERLNLDAASFRQLSDQHDGDGDAVRARVRQIVRDRGKMHNPVTGSGGMLIGTVAEVGPQSPLGLKVGQKIASLVSLTCTPLVLESLDEWDGRSEQVPCRGHAILFGRSIAAVLPDDLPPKLALAVMDVCGAPALTHRVVSAYVERAGGESAGPTVCVIGAGGKSGSLALAAARSAGAGRRIGVVPLERERAALIAAGALDEAPLADVVVLADARNPVALAAAVAEAGGPADITVVCVDVPDCEHGAVLATKDGGTVIFFSMATSFSAAALGAEAVAADITMLIGNGYATGHAELALAELRRSPGVRSLYQARITEGKP